VQQRRTAAGLAGQAEFTLEYEPDALTERGIDWLVTGLEESIREGSRFPVGETVGIGWLDCYVMDRGDGTLGLCEPDFVHFPPALVAGASNALEQLWFQREIARSVGLEPELDFPNHLQPAVTCAAFDADLPAVLMHRYSHEEGESGWFIGCRGAVHEHTGTALRSATLYELALAKPVIVGYLALPPDCSVVVGDGAPEITRRNEVLIPEPGSLLAKMYS
jgi:hypothetical protein